MVDEKLTAGIAAIKAGNKTAARQFLIDIVRSDPNNETAWLWLSACVETLEQKKQCLQRALAINPSNQDARGALDQLEEHVKLHPPESKTSPSPSQTFQPVRSVERRESAAITQRGSIQQPAQRKSLRNASKTKTSRTFSARYASIMVVAGVILGFGGAGIFFIFWATSSHPASDVASAPSGTWMPIGVTPTQPLTEQPAITASLSLPIVANSNPTQTPRPQSSPTPSLYQGTAKSYLPGQSEMPLGFGIDASGSGPLEKTDCVGYAITYRKSQLNADEFHGVIYVLLVCDTKTAAKLTYDEFVKADKGDYSLDSLASRLTGVDEVTVSGTVTSTESVIVTTVIVDIRKRNIVVRIGLIGPVTSADNFESWVTSETLYYSSLVIEKLK